MVAWPQADAVRGEVAFARAVYNSTSTWWQRLLGQAPPVTLGSLLKGTPHNISWEEFAHASCLVTLFDPDERNRHPIDVNCACGHVGAGAPLL